MRGLAAASWGRRGALTLLLVAAPAAAQDGSTSTPVPAPTPSRTIESGTGDVSAPAPASPPGPDLARPAVDPPVSAPPTPVAAPAGAPLPPIGTAPASPEEHHHTGLYVHADAGAGYLRTTGSRGGSAFAGEGGAFGFGLAFGWAPDEEWALALEGWVWSSLSASGLGPNTTMGVQGLGLNVTRYIVPIDLFATVVVSGTRLAITEDDAYSYVEDAHSDIGFGLRIRLGKEWRVTQWLGLGIAAEFFLSVNRDGGQTLDTLGGGLLFSITGR